MRIAIYSLSSFCISLFLSLSVLVDLFGMQLLLTRRFRNVSHTNIHRHCSKVWIVAQTISLFLKKVAS